MPIDPNEAPEGFYAVESKSGLCLGCDIGTDPGSCPKNQAYPIVVFCGSLNRKDKCEAVFKKKPQPTEMKPMESEHEYLDADSLENCKKILEWTFADGCEMKRTAVSKDIIMQVEWESASGVLKGRTYRRKKPQTKKVKKLVPRTPEELMQLIGKCLIRMKTTPEIVHLLIDNDYDGDQEHWEMCYIGEYVWGPMMKEIEV